MPTTILLLLLAWSSPSSGASEAGPRPEATASPRRDAHPRVPAALLIRADEGHPGWPCRAVAIVEVQDDDSDGDLTLPDRTAPRPRLRSSGTPGSALPHARRHAAGRSPILRC